MKRLDAILLVVPLALLRDEVLLAVLLLQRRAVITLLTLEDKPAAEHGIDDQSLDLEPLRRPLEPHERADQALGLLLVCELWLPLRVILWCKTISPSYWPDVPLELLLVLPPVPKNEPCNES